MRFSYVIVWLPYLLIGFFNIGVPVVRTYGGDSPLLPYPPPTPHECRRTPVLKWTQPTNYEL